jgi:hypothetical protein
MRDNKCDNRINVVKMCIIIFLNKIKIIFSDIVKSRWL